MFNFSECDFRPASSSVSIHTVEGHLASVTEMLDEETREQIFEAAGIPVTAEVLNFSEVLEMTERDMLALAAAFMRVAEDPLSRNLIHWHLACLGNEVAKSHLKKAIQEKCRITKNTSLKNHCKTLIQDWGEVKAEEVPEGVVVAKSVGDPLSKDARDLTTRYKAILGTSLPYAGSRKKFETAYDDLNDKYPWAQEVVSRVFGQIALRIRTAKDGVGVNLRPFLIHGDPGCGKTSFIGDLFAAFDIPASTFSCGGTSDSGGLLPIARGWSTSTVCGPLQAMLAHKVCNPGVILDEVDKASSLDSKNGSVIGALLGMINDSAPYYDTCLMTSVDLTKVSFAATANDINNIPKPLLDRFNVVRMPSPTEAHFDTIIKSVEKDQARELGVPPEDLPELTDFEKSLIFDEVCGASFSIRQIKQKYRGILEQNALQDMMGDEMMLQKQHKELLPRS